MNSTVFYWVFYGRREYFVFSRSSSWVIQAANYMQIISVTLLIKTLRNSCIHKKDQTSQINKSSYTVRFV